MTIFTASYLAQRPQGLGGEFRGIGPLGCDKAGGCSDVLSFFPRVISIIIGVLTVAAILWFIFQFIIGAFKWISAGGDSKQVESARNQILQAVVGMIIILVALVLISVLGNVFGLDILNLQSLLTPLKP